MGYTLYIKKNNKKTGGPWYIADRALEARNNTRNTLVILCVMVVSIFPGGKSWQTPSSAMPNDLSVTEGQPLFREEPMAKPKLSKPKPANNNTLSITHYHANMIPPIMLAPETPVKAEPNWQSIEVQSGENLALIFKRKRLPSSTLHNIMALGRDVSALKKLQTGKEIRFLIKDNQLQAMQYVIEPTKTLQINRSNGVYSAEIHQAKPITKVHTASGVINDSLFLAAKGAGLSDSLIMQLVAIYGWDIDFAKEVHKGDRFRILYEEHYLGGDKIRDGVILAAEFINRGKSLKTVRYRSDYYTDGGDNMRKAFIMTPVKYDYISSRFSLRRKHPILNTIRAHKGVDYAAAEGTPIKAAGDGIVKFIGFKNGYGKTIILQHGGKYTTLYAHMARYAKGLKKGRRVKQGDIIGYVGMTGLATGPHLHYEFRVNGLHRNPLTVQLPKSRQIPDSLIAEFKSQTKPLIQQLDNITIAWSAVDSKRLITEPRAEAKAASSTH